MTPIEIGRIAEEMGELNGDPFMVSVQLVHPDDGWFYPHGQAAFLRDDFTYFSNDLAFDFTADDDHPECIDNVKMSEGSYLIVFCDAYVVAVYVTDTADVEAVIEGMNTPPNGRRPFVPLELTLEEIRGCTPDVQIQLLGTEGYKELHYGEEDPVLERSETSDVHAALEGGEIVVQRRPQGHGLEILLVPGPRNS